jgi:hypothetical protein
MIRPGGLRRGSTLSSGLRSSRSPKPKMNSVSPGQAASRLIQKGRARLMGQGRDSPAWFSTHSTVPVNSIGPFHNAAGPGSDHGGAARP